MLLGWQVPTKRLAGCGGGCGCAPCRGGLGALGDAQEDAHDQAATAWLDGAERAAAAGNCRAARNAILQAVPHIKQVRDRSQLLSRLAEIDGATRACEDTPPAAESTPQSQVGRGSGLLSSLWSSLSQSFTSPPSAPPSTSRRALAAPKLQAQIQPPKRTSQAPTRPSRRSEDAPPPDPEGGSMFSDSGGAEQQTLADTVAQAGAAGDAKTADAAGSFLGMSESFGGGLNLPMGILGVGAGAASGISILEINKGKGSDKPLTSKQIQKKRTTSLITGSATGAVSGAAFGTMVFPGIGTAIGAVVGGAGGAAGALIANKNLAKKNRKLKQRQIATNLTAIQAQRAEEAAAADEARQARAQLDRAKLRVGQLEREADRWLIAVRQQRGDLDSAEALRQEVASLRIEAASARDLDTAQLIAQQAAEAVDNLKALAGQRTSSLQGLGSCYDGACGVWNRPQRGLGDLFSSIGDAVDTSFAPSGEPIYGLDVYGKTIVVGYTGGQVARPSPASTPRPVVLSPQPYRPAPVPVRDMTCDTPGACDVYGRPILRDAYGRPVLPPGRLPDGTCAPGYQDTWVFEGPNYCKPIPAATPQTPQPLPAPPPAPSAYGWGEIGCNPRTGICHADRLNKPAPVPTAFDVWNTKPLAGRRGLGGLGSANDHVFAVRRANRAALGLTPQEDTPSSGGLGAGVILAAVVFGTMLGPDLFAAFGGSGGSKKRR